MKTFRVLVTAYRQVIVKAENAEDAEHFVFTECTGEDWTIERAQVDEELKTAREIARCKARGAVDMRDW